MGTRISRRRRGMDSGESTESGPGRGGGHNSNDVGGASSSRLSDDDVDLATILSYLIRSGQVRIMSSHGQYDDDDDDDDDDEELAEFGYEDDFVPRARKPEVDTTPDTSGIEKNDLCQQIQVSSGQKRASGCYNKLNSINHLLHKREVGICQQKSFSHAECCAISCKFLPNKMEPVARYHNKVFCGTFSKDGNIFLSACQDQRIRIFDTSRGGFREMKTIRARDVGWSVLDTAFSPDGNYLIYSSWSDSVHLCNIHGDHDVHLALNLCPQPDHSFCIFSLTFSSDNSEILGGANDRRLYVFDRERNERTLSIRSHEDDVNAVAFADDSSHILFSGGDDGLIKVWDRRTLCETRPEPVGVLAGHFDGVTFIDSKGDARYLISNCKDQTIKLWDIRKFSSPHAQTATKKAVSQQRWDYRWQQVPKKIQQKRERLAGDTSLMTYRGHSVLHTLIRCRFSPQFTTGQRYIYSGCATGAVVIYDLLTGCIESKLTGHTSCVRDVSWHPYEHRMMSTSWDCSVGCWQHEKSPEEYDSDMKEGETDDDDDTPDDGVRRSERIKNRHSRSFGNRLRSTFLR